MHAISGAKTSTLIVFALTVPPSCFRFDPPRHPLRFVPSRCRPTFAQKYSQKMSKNQSSFLKPAKIQNQKQSAVLYSLPFIFPSTKVVYIVCFPLFSINFLGTAALPYQEKKNFWDHFQGPLRGTILYDFCLLPFLGTICWDFS